LRQKAYFSWFYVLCIDPQCSCFISKKGITQTEEVVGGGGIIMGPEKYLWSKNGPKLPPDCLQKHVIAHFTPNHQQYCQPNTSKSVKIQESASYSGIMGIYQLYNLPIWLFYWPGCESFSYWAHCRSVLYGLTQVIDLARHWYAEFSLVYLKKGT
jgi:hypothetical protein